MIGDFFGGSLSNTRADSVVDRLIVLADDLDAPLSLPSGGSTLGISEQGPIGIFSSSLASVSQLQTILRSGGTIPSASLQGTINTNAILFTSATVSQIQSQLAGTPLPTTLSFCNRCRRIFRWCRRRVSVAQWHHRSYDIQHFRFGCLDPRGSRQSHGGEDLDAYYFYDYVVRFNTALSDATSGGVGRIKIAEGGSILPIDRVFLRYSNIHNVAFTNGRQTLNRFVPGFERTFYDRLMSVELRAPFATDAATTYSLDTHSFSNGNNTRFGNLMLYAKALLHQSERLVVSGGMGIALPTASDIEVNYANGDSLLRIDNESVHLQPFLGVLYSPGPRFFAQGFLQYDAATSGNSVAINSTGNGLHSAGKLTDSNNFFLDAGLGYWLYRTNADRGVTGIVPTVECHQTASTQDGDMVAAGPFQVGNFHGSTSVTSVVAGTTIEFGGRSQLALGYATPLGGGADRQYDGAFQFFFNRLIGR